MTVFDELRSMTSDVDVIQRLSDQYRQNMLKFTKMDLTTSDSITWCDTADGRKIGIAYVPRFLIFCRAAPVSDEWIVDTYDMPEVGTIDIIDEEFQAACANVASDDELDNAISSLIHMLINTYKTALLGVTEDGGLGLIALPFLHVHSGESSMIAYTDFIEGNRHEIYSNKKIAIRHSPNITHAPDIISLTRYWTHRFIMMDDTSVFRIAARYYFSLRPGIMLALTHESLIVAVNSTVEHGLLIYDPTQTVFIAHGLDYASLLRNIHKHEALAEQIDEILPPTAEVMSTVHEWGRHIIAMF